MNALNEAILISISELRPGWVASQRPHCSLFKAIKKLLHSPLLYMRQVAAAPLNEESDPRTL